MKSSQTFLYNNLTGNIQYIDKTKFIKEILLINNKQPNKKQFSLQDISKYNNLTYKGLIETFNNLFKKLSNGIYICNIGKNMGIICLLDKTTDDFEKLCKKNNWKFGQEIKDINKDITINKEEQVYNNIINYRPKESKIELKNNNKKLLKKVAVMSLAALISIPNLIMPSQASGIIYSGCKGNTKIESIYNNQQFTKYDRVAVLGNSNGSLFSFYTNVDRDDSIQWQNEAFSNNAAGGDSIDSIIKYPGTNVPILLNFITKANDYDYAIIWLGTNEIQGHQSANSYKKRLDAYLTVLTQANPNLKILLMQVPMGRNVKEPDLFIKNVPVFNKVQEEVAAKYPQVDIINYDSINPEVAQDTPTIAVHLTYNTQLKIWDLIKNKYNLNVEYKQRHIDETRWNLLTSITGNSSVDLSKTTDLYNKDVVKANFK